MHLSNLCTRIHNINISSNNPNTRFKGTMVDSHQIRRPNIWNGTKNKTNCGKSGVSRTYMPDFIETWLHTTYPSWVNSQLVMWDHSRRPLDTIEPLAYVFINLSTCIYTHTYISTMLKFIKKFWLNLFPRKLVQYDLSGLMQIYLIQNNPLPRNWVQREFPSDW